MVSRRETAGSTSGRTEVPVPIASMVESIVGCKWSVRLLWLIAEGQTRPSALLRASPGLSAKVMHERLRKMVRFGLVERHVFGEKPPVEVDYRLTPFGRRFMRILGEIRRLQAEVDGGTEPRGDTDEPQRMNVPSRSSA